MLVGLDALSSPLSPDPVAESLIMRSQDRVTFSWRPESPITSFACAVVTNQDAVPRRAYAVTVSAVDADGEHVEPLGDEWTYSSGLRANYRYTPASPDAGTAMLKPWRSDVYLQRVEITVVAWLPDDASPDIVAAAFAPLSDTDDGGRSWSIVHRSTEEAA